MGRQLGATLKPKTPLRASQMEFFTAMGGGRRVFPPVAVVAPVSCPAGTRFGGDVHEICREQNQRPYRSSGGLRDSASYF